MKLCVRSNEPDRVLREEDSAKDFDGLRNVFETFLVEPAPNGSAAVRALAYHMERLQHSCAHFGFRSPPVSEIRSALCGLCAHHSNDKALRAKLLVSEGSWILQSQPFNPRFPVASGIRLVSFQGERSDPQHKSGDTTTSELASTYARSQGADEALLYDSKDIVREGAWTNFFWISKQGKIVTPATKMLPGIMRRLVLEAAVPTLPIEQQDYSLSEILDSMIAGFVTNALHGIVSINEIDGRLLTRSTLTDAVIQLVDARPVEELGPCEIHSATPRSGFAV